MSQITVWIDEILQESEDRMLMMDVDEDDGKCYFLFKLIIMARYLIDFCKSTIS